MSKIERPLSPHLQVYRLPFAAWMSILHRITGAGLAVGAIMLTWWLFAAATGGNCWEALEAFRASIIGQLMLFGWLLAYVYHFLNGIRHLKWDTGHGLSLKSINRSGMIVAFGSVFISLFIWFLGAY